MKDPKLTTISLGWGLQSWTLAAMSALGHLPPVDCAIHADTTWEHEDTYAFAAEMTPWLEQHGIPVYTVDDREQARKVTTNKTDIPAFTLTEGPRAKGMLRRQCTGRWKIMPMRRMISTLLLAKGLKKREGIVESWLGITTDEYTRAKDSDVKYIRNRFPLLEQGMSRQDCADWLKQQRLPVPGKSSCVFCPYKNMQAWEDMKRRGGKDWETAVLVDESIRHARPPYPLFVHPGRVPLQEIVLTDAREAAEPWAYDDDDAECGSGHCFL